MHLLYITFGNKFSTHLQAAFSIYTFLSVGHLRSVNVITDAPQFYQHLKDQVRIIPVTESTLKEWQGPHQFFWRIKIKAVQQLCSEYTGEPVLYVDTDTFLYDKEALSTMFAHNNAWMHEWEGDLNTSPYKTEKKMGRQLKKVLFEGSAITPMEMWNAGVVGIPNATKGAECAYALRLCDALCEAGVSRRLIEQFSFSVALQQFYKLQAAHTFIGHYWSTKAEWEVAISAFFLEAQFKQYDRAAMIRQASAFDFSQLPVKKLERNTARRLHTFVGNAFKPKEITYIDIKK